MGVDPTTGLIDGNELLIWAARMPDVDQAHQRYDQLRKARKQLDCFTGPEQQQMVPGKKLAQQKQSPRWEIYGDGVRSASYSLLQRGNVVFVVSAAKARAAFGRRSTRQGDRRPRRPAGQLSGHKPPLLPFTRFRPAGWRAPMSSSVNGEATSNGCTGVCPRPSARALSIRFGLH